MRRVYHILGWSYVAFCGVVVTRSVLAKPAPSHASGSLPVASTSADATEWFRRARPYCNAVEITVLQRQVSPPATLEGAGFHAACFALAGKIDDARRIIDALPATDRPRAAGIVFDVGHPVADAGDDRSAAPIMEMVKARRPDVKVVAVQAEEAAAFPGSLAAGQPVALPAMTTMADGIAVACPGDLTFAHVRGLVDEVRTVTEEDLSRALLFCLERSKLVVEPDGVAAVAAVLADPAAFTPPVVAVVSGGNIDPVLLLKVIQHGLAAAGRYLSLRLRVPDRPGSLAAVP